MVIGLATFTIRSFSYGDDESTCWERDRSTEFDTVCIANHFDLACDEVDVAVILTS
jgi:hypothetical protein